MSGFMRDVEQDFSGGNDQQQSGGYDQSNQGGGFGQSNQGGGFDQNQQQSGGYDQSGGQQQQSSGNNSRSSNGGGFMSEMKTTGEDGMVNQGMSALCLLGDLMLTLITEVNSFMNKEGIPVGADGAVDNFVDKEANKFI